jgi:hypothetical protein
VFSGQLHAALRLTGEAQLTATKLTVDGIGSGLVGVTAEEEAEAGLTGGTLRNHAKGGITATDRAVLTVQDMKVSENREDGVHYGGTATGQCNRVTFERNGAGLRVSDHAQPYVGENEYRANGEADIVVDATVSTNVMIPNAGPGVRIRDLRAGRWRWNPFSR